MNKVAPILHAAAIAVKPREHYKFVMFEGVVFQVRRPYIQRVSGD